MTKYDLKVGTELVLKKEINQYGICVKAGEKVIVKEVDFALEMVILEVKGIGKMFGIIEEILEYFELPEEEKSKKCNVINVDSDIEKILHDGKTTVVILEDDSVGIAHCAMKDTYDKEVGERVAYIKAKIESLKKELKQY